jgi:hypothetical protein
MTFVTWGELRRDEPSLAETGRELFYHFGIGLGFLATTRKDGAPRVHPICAIIAGEGLYGLIIPSPKLNDLRRDGRYALHSYPLEDNEDAFYVTGRAEERADEEARNAVIQAFVHEPGRQGPPLDPSHFVGQTLVEFLIETCLLTQTTGHGDPAPRHAVWRAR